MDEMRYMRLYGAKRKVYIPFNPKSKKKGAAIMLLTKDSVDSHTIMNLPYLYNPGYYESLYIDRNITAFIDSGAIIDEDEGEVNESAAITEAIIHNQRKPGDITILYNFAPGCTPNDVAIVKKFYNEARIMHWLRYFKTNHRRYPESLTIHCYTSVQAMAKDCLPDALERQEIVLNSWSDEENIYVVAPRGFGAIKIAEGGNYQFYYANELITWAAMRSSPACSRQLACYVGTALSGRMSKRAMDKIEDNYGDVKDSSMAAAWAVKCLYDEEGDSAIRGLVKCGDVSILTSRVVSKYAGKAWEKIKPIIREGCSEQRAFLEGFLPDDIMQFNKKLNAIPYGFNELGKDKPHKNDDKLDAPECYYRMASPSTFENLGKGVCWDFCAYEAEWFSKNLHEIQYKTYYVIFTGDSDNTPNHTFLIFKYGKFYYLFESSNKRIKGIWKSTNEKDLIDFEIESMNLKVHQKHLEVYEYNARHPGTYGMDIIEFMEWVPAHSKKISHNYNPNYQVFKADSIVEEAAPLNEGYIIPGKDIESNTRMWMKGHNILYVTGLSGGGKSTIARELAYEVDGIYIELDLICHAKNFVGQDKYNRTDMALINEYWKKNKLTKDPMKMPDAEYEKYFAGVWKYLLDYMKKHSDELFVVEGIQVIKIAHVFNPEIINEPMIIKGTSVLQAMIRRYNRDGDAANNIGVRANEKGLLGGIKDLIHLVYWYYDQEYSLGFLRRAVKEVPQQESAGIPLPSQTVLMEDWKQPGPSYVINEDYISDGEFITFFNGMDEQVITEAEKKYDSKLKKWLFKERLKNNKMVLMRYQELKAMNPDIKYTFLKLPMYRSKNIWIDLSYYHGLFLKNMVASKTNAVNIYWDFLNRLIIEKEYSSIYNKISIFIPCWPQAWGAENAKQLMDYKTSLNPVSMILRMLIKNPSALKKWGNKDIVFMAPNGYFKINFETFNLRDMPKFKKLIDRLAKGEVIDDDEDEDGYTDEKTDTDSPAVITAKITDKIEKNMGIKLDDITGKRQKDKFGYQSDYGDGQQLAALDPPASDFTHLRMRTGTITLPERDKGGIGLERDKKLNSGVLIMGRKDTQAIDVMASDRIKYMNYQAAFYKPDK